MIVSEKMEKQGNWLFRLRGTLPLILLMFCGYAYWLSEAQAGEIFLKQQPYRYVYEMCCLLIGLSGFAIRVLTIGYTPGNTSGRNTRSQVADRLNTTGLYSIVRNPLYLGNFLMWLGVAMLTMNIWFIVAFCLFYWLYYERIIIAEESFLIRKFGDEYLGWAARTPCFVPRFSGYVKPTYTFSFKKVLKKEKNGIFALLLIFCIFDASERAIDGAFPKYMWLVWLTVFMALIYFSLKMVRIHTGWLNESGR